MSHGHGHDDIVKPFNAKEAVGRCYDRWLDWMALECDSLKASHVTKLGGIDTVNKALRERYLLFVQCIESKPGQEPKQSLLYDQGDLLKRLAKH